MIPTITTERLVLAEWTPTDVDEYARICTSPEVMRYMWPARPATPAESAYGVQLLREHWVRWGFGHWAVHEKDSGRFVGRTGAKRHDDWEPDPENNTEIGWLYDPAVWGRGYATEGARAALAFCLGEVGADEVISIAHPDNAASQRVMANVGLRYAGARHWDARGIDVVWYSNSSDEET